MKFIIFLIIIAVPLMSEMKIDFGKDKAGSDWVVINDGVMGGKSNGSMHLKENSLVFKGDVSTANNGGFSTIRSRFRSFDLSGYSVVSVRYKSEGHSFSMTLEDSKPFNTPYYKAEMPGEKDQWQTAKMSLFDFAEYILGRKTGNELTEDKLDKIIRLGFINAEKKDGEFSLEIDYILFE